MTPDQILNDFKRRYENTFVFVQSPESEKPSLFHVDSIQDNRDRIGIINLSSEEVGKIKLNFASAHTLVFVQIPVGVFQCRKEAIVCRRIPARQWRRGICSDNTQLVPATSYVVQSGALRFSYENIAELFEQKTYPVKEALALLDARKVLSVALPDNFSMCQPLSENSTDYVVFFWDIPVAKVSAKGEITQVLEAAFKTELTKAFTNV